MKSSFTLAEAAEAFACFEKPSTYIEADLYEPERDEYEQMLGGRPREALGVTNFGTVAWGPLCYLTPEAMAYLLPRLMELAASDAKDRIDDLFMMRFINRFSNGPSGAEFSLLNATHRSVIASFLEYLAAEHGDLVRQECWEDVLAEAILNWRDA
jgi:hypothetical protein